MTVIRRTILSDATIKGRLMKSAKAVLEDAAEETRVRTVDGIAAGGGNGPSSPGEFPNTDSGDLENSYNAHVSVKGDHVIATVGSSAPHAVALELGTSKIAPRPHLSPSFEEGVQEMKQNLKNAAKAALR